jgi:hypothetical protein
MLLYVQGQNSILGKSNLTSDSGKIFRSCWTDESLRCSCSTALGFTENLYMNREIDYFEVRVSFLAKKK